MIEARGLVKRYGDKTAVDDLSFDVRPGIVTGFLGPNGAGKSTTMRMIIGLDAPSAGSVSVNGRRYVDHAAPLHEVGALLEARAVHAGRSARNHLLALAATTGIPNRRVDELLDLVGLTEVATKRVGADHLIVIGRGRLIADVSVDEFVNQASSDIVHVRSPQAERLRDLVAGPTVQAALVGANRLEVIGMSSDDIGNLAAANAIALHELTPQQASLEEAFMTLTRDSVEYHTSETATR